MESQAKPDVQFGKIFIVLWMGLMLFIIILIIVNEPVIGPNGCAPISKIIARNIAVF